MICCNSEVNQNNGPMLRQINVVKLGNHLLGGELVKSKLYKRTDEQLYLGYNKSWVKVEYHIEIIFLVHKVRIILNTNNEIRITTKLRSLSLLNP